MRRSRPSRATRRSCSHSGRRARDGPRLHAPRERDSLRRTPPPTRLSSRKTEEDRHGAAETYDEPALQAFAPMPPDVLRDSPGCNAWRVNAPADERPRKRSLWSGVVTRRVGGTRSKSARMPGDPPRSASMPRRRPSERGPAYPAGLADGPSRGRRPRAIPAESSWWRPWWWWWWWWPLRSEERRVGQVGWFVRG